MSWIAAHAHQEIPPLHGHTWTVLDIQGSIVQPLQGSPRGLPPNLPVLRGCTLLLMGGLSLSKAVVNFMTLMKVLLVAWSAEWMMVWNLNGFHIQDAGHMMTMHTPF